MGSISDRIIDLAFSWQRLVISAALGIASFALARTGLMVLIGPGVFSDASEIFVSLGAALGGPAGGALTGLIGGLGFMPEVNIPVHVLSGFLTGVWYIVLWDYAKSKGLGRPVRIAVWSISVLAFYYLLTLPLYAWIFSGMESGTSFLDLYADVAPDLLPEAGLTMLVTSFVLFVIPDSLAAPEP